MTSLTKSKIKKALENVLDPEINISIVDLGLIYDIILNKDKIKIVMTLTTIGCPLYNLIHDEIKNKLINLGFKEQDIEIELTFDPPWSIERLSPKAKKLLGI